MLILTSFGFESPILCRKLREYVKTEEKNVLVIPFAGRSSDECFKAEKNFLISYGFHPDKIHYVSALEDLKKADYIYVPGGSTFKLLSEVQRLGLCEKIRELIEGGAVYIGSSAGAELSCCDLQYVSVLEDDNFGIIDFDGLGMVEDIIIPHSDQVPVSVKMRCRAFGRQLICIPNDGAAIYSGSEFELI